ncbi:MAG: 30S ribosomal protein S21 [Ignavibacteria bacterium]|nr:30S ribosomal protein S21 [Ignavibacteria bacterium]
MIGVILQSNENIDKALRRFKKKFEKSGILREYKRKTAYVKPSVEKRMQRLKTLRRIRRTSIEEM